MLFFNVILPETDKNGCFDKFLPVSTSPFYGIFILFATSIKNQARLTRKIVGSS